MRERTPAPASQAGSGAVRRAEQDKSMADAASVAGLEAVVVTGTGFDGNRPRSGVNPTQRVGGRLFIMRDSTWTDLSHGDSLNVVSIAPYSEAYFALLSAMPDLREPAALGPAVVVAGKHASIKIADGGKSRWLPGELERVVRQFRG